MIPHVVTIHHSACRGDSPPPAVFSRAREVKTDRERERESLPLKRLFFPVAGSQAPADQQPTPLPLSPHLSPSNPLFLSLTASPFIPLLLLSRPLCIFIFQNISFFFSYLFLPYPYLPNQLFFFLPVILLVWSTDLSRFSFLPPLCSSSSPCLRLLTVLH